MKIEYVKTPVNISLYEVIMGYVNLWPVTSSLKVETLFYVMRFMHKQFHFNPAYVNNWESMGGLDKERPW